MNFKHIFSRWDNLWCSHHSAFVKLPPHVFQATFKGGSQRSGIGHSMYFFSAAELLLRTGWRAVMLFLHRSGGLSHLTLSKKFPLEEWRGKDVAFFFHNSKVRSLNVWDKRYCCLGVIVNSLLFFFHTQHDIQTYKFFSTRFAITEPQQFHLRVFLEGIRPCQIPVFLLFAILPPGNAWDFYWILILRFFEKNTWSFPRRSQILEIHINHQDSLASRVFPSQSSTQKSTLERFRSMDWRLSGISFSSGEKTPNKNATKRTSSEKSFRIFHSRGNFRWQLVLHQILAHPIRVLEASTNGMGIKPSSSQECCSGVIDDTETKAAYCAKAEVWKKRGWPVAASTAQSTYRDGRVVWMEVNAH